MPAIFVITNPTPANQNSKDDKLEGVPPDWHEVDPTEEGKSLRFALELVFEDGLMARREGDGDKGGVGGRLREDNERANTGCGCV